MGNNPAFQCYAADFMTDTADYSNRELGAYFRLLCHQWINEKLPPDTKRLATICRESHGGFMAIWLRFAEKFPLSDDGFLRNHRMQAQRLNLSAYQELQREAGRIGGKASAEKRKGRSSDPTSDPTSEPGSEKQALQSSSSKTTKPSLPPTPLPEWVSQESWNGFEEMRKKLRKPLTLRAATLLINKLEAFYLAGADVNAIIDQSTMNSWQGFFPVKKNEREESNGNRASQRQAENRAAIAGAVRESVFGEVDGFGTGKVPQPEHHAGDVECVVEGLGLVIPPGRKGTV